MTLFVKLGIGFLGAITAGATGYGVYELSRSKTIKEILYRSHQVLKTEGTEDDDKWTKLIGKHNGTESEGSALPKISGLKTSGLTNEDLKAKCVELFSKFYKDENQQDYINAKNWCTTFQISS